MKSWKLGLIIGALSTSFIASASNIGISSHPWGEKTSMFNGELSGSTGADKSKGVQLRYLRKLNDVTNIDTGFRITDGERSSRMFVGLDYEIFPDFQDQPRVSVKTIVESTKDFGHRRNNVGFAPTISKGVAIGEQELFPFLALPTKVSLDSNDNTYQSQTSLATGLTTPIKVEGFQGLIANVEANLNLRNSYNFIAVGITMPIN